MAERARVVYQKLEHPRWKISSHQGSVTSIFVRQLLNQEGKKLARVLTGGSDGSVRLWDGKHGKPLSKQSIISEYCISCLSYANGVTYAGDGAGYIHLLDGNLKPITTWRPHQKEISCLQVVNEGRVFTGSLDGTLKLCNKEGKQLACYPKDVEHAGPEVHSFKVIRGNLIIVGQGDGRVAIYNTKQELLQILKTASLEGIALQAMDVMSYENKITIVCGNKARLTCWFLTREENTLLHVNAVKTYQGRVPNGYVSHVHGIYVNPLFSQEPAVLLGSSSGDLYLYIPTVKIEAASQSGRYVEAQKFKAYTFKGTLQGNSYPISAMGCGGTKVFAGTTKGNVMMWKDPENLKSLHRLCRPSAMAHPYNTSVSRSKKESHPRHKEVTDMGGDEIVFLASNKLLHDDIDPPHDSTPNIIRVEGISEVAPEPPLPGQQEPIKSQQAPVVDLLASPPSHFHFSRSDSGPHEELFSLTMDANKVGNGAGDASTGDDWLNLMSPPRDNFLQTTPAPLCSSFQSLDPFQNILPSMGAPTTISTAPTPVFGAGPAVGTLGSVSSIGSTIPDCCFICKRAARNAALYQCGHTCICFPCGKQLVSQEQPCPMCHVIPLDCLKVFD